MSINFNSLKYFLTIAEELSVTRASRKLYISQQALSEHIAKVEKHYGVSMFVRSNHGRRLSLTPSGEQLVLVARQILQLEQQFEDSCNVLSSRTRDTLRLGTTPARGELLIPGALYAFSRLHPEIKLSIRTGHFEQLRQEFINGDLDMLLGFDKTLPTCNFQSIEISEERIFFVCRRDVLSIFCPKLLAMPSPVISYGELKLLDKLPLLLFPSDSYTRHVIDLIFEKSSVTPVIAMEASQSSMLLRMAQQGIGATFSLESLICKNRHMFAPKLSSQMLLIPLDLSEACVKVSLFFFKNYKLKAPIQDLARAIQNEYESMRTALHIHK